MEKLKQILNKDKKTSNLILILALLVIVLIFMNYIFNEPQEIETKEAISENVTSNIDFVEIRLANIISKIKGVENASVMVSFSSTEKIIPVYDTKENIDTTTEEDKTSSKKTIEKTVAYEGEGNSKNALVESKENAEATGAIIVVSGNITDSIKLEIKEAVSMVTSVPLYRIQIFVN